MRNYETKMEVSWLVSCIQFESLSHHGGKQRADWQAWDWYNISVPTSDPQAAGREKVRQGWCGFLKSQIPPPVTHFQQGYTSSNKNISPNPPKLVHQLGTRRSNILAYGGHAHSNYIMGGIYWSQGKLF